MDISKVVTSIAVWINSLLSSCYGSTPMVFIYNCNSAAHRVTHCGLHVWSTLHGVPERGKGGHKPNKHTDISHGERRHICHLFTPGLLHTSKPQIAANTERFSAYL